MDILLTIIASIMIGLGVLLLYDVVLQVWRGRHRTETWVFALLGIMAIVAYAFAIINQPHLSFPLCKCGISIRQTIALLLDLIAIYVVITFLVFCIRSLYCIDYEVKSGSRYIIVLGGGLVGRRVGRMLAARLQKGIECLQAGAEGCRIIVSGGQGPDEEVSEASAMREYLLGCGIPDDLIVMEDRSRTTVQNMACCVELLQKLGYGTADGASTPERTDSVARDANERESSGTADGTDVVHPAITVVTNDFHALRAYLLAKKAGFEDFAVVSCHTLWYYFPAAFMRDFIGYELVYAAWFLLWVALCAMLIVGAMAFGVV